jgi:hypothetical protein
MSGMNEFDDLSKQALLASCGVRECTMTDDPKVIIVE